MMTEKRTAANLADWQGYLSQAEVSTMKQLTQDLPPKAVIVKIGAGAGTDSLAILETRQDVVIFSIDIHCCDQPTVTNEHLRLPEAGFADTGHVIRIWGDSKVVGKRWPIPVDFIFVDGCHTEPCKRGDIETWLPHVNEGGIMAFHNYGSSKWPAVKPVVDELMTEFEQIAKVDTLVAYRVGYPKITWEEFESVEANEFAQVLMTP